MKQKTSGILILGMILFAAPFILAMLGYLLGFILGCDTERIIAGNNGNCFIHVEFIESIISTLINLVWFGSLTMIPGIILIIIGAIEEKTLTKKEKLTTNLQIPKKTSLIVNIVKWTVIGLMGLIVIGLILLFFLS